MIADLERAAAYAIAEHGWPVRWRCYLLDVVDDGWPRSTKVATRFIDAASGELVVLDEERFHRAAIVHPRDVTWARTDLESIEEHIEPQPYGRHAEVELERERRFAAYRAKCER